MPTYKITYGIKDAQQQSIQHEESEIFAADDYAAKSTAAKLAKGLFNDGVRKGHFTKRIAFKTEADWMRYRRKHITFSATKIKE